MRELPKCLGLRGESSSRMKEIVQVESWLVSSVNLHHIDDSSGLAVTLAWDTFEPSI